MGTDTYINLRAFVDELVRCGMRAAVTSPGSRNTPLLLTLAREPRLKTLSQIDERCAGFLALGMAKASGLPVAVTCTSGTAAANLAPAVIEAHEARVPLVVLTADRPPELRDVGAGQTIDQVKLYGSAAKWFVEVDDHPATAERVGWMRQLACRAFWTAHTGRPGAVHLNFSLREPLVPGGPVPDPPPGRPGGRPWVDVWRAAEPPRPAVATERQDAGSGRSLFGGGRPERDDGAARRAVVVAGRSERGDATGLAGACAHAHVPLLADPLSGARRGPAAIAHYDAFLRAEWPHPPDLVIRVGDLPTSKPLRQWLAGLDCEQLAVDPESAWQDPAQAVSIVLPSLPPLAKADAGWLEAWRAADRAASGAIAGVLAEAGLSEPRVAAELGTWLPADATLVVASSMPVRDVETFFPVRDDPPRVLANRGANGIDGTLSTAYGVAATGARTFCLVGDVAMAYDVGALLSARRNGLDVTFVLLNNDGGGIFDFLPVAGEDPEFTAHVATPHGLDFAHAAALYGLTHTRVDTPEAFREAVRVPGIVEVRTDRTANVALHRAVWEAVRAAL